MLPARDRPRPGHATSGVVFGRPLIRVSRTDLATHTNLRGQFTRSGLSGTTVTLIATRIGYQPRTQPATVGATDVRIPLGVSVLRLDELVVTGQAGDTRKRALGNV